MTHTTFRMLALAVAWLPAMALAGNPAKPGSNFTTWIDREWEYRYLLLVRDNWGLSQKLEQESWVKAPLDVANQYAEGHFNPSLILVPAATGHPDAAERAVLRLDVARDRTVLTPTLQGKIVEARLNRLEDIVLAPKGESPPSFTIDFGHLFLGAYYAANPAYTPSLCTSLDMEADPNFRGRYQKKFKADSKYLLQGSDGYFGCREWAAQLYDADRPYIDVTSYESGPDVTKPKKGGGYTVGPVTYIKPFIGFSRFQDAPKPVIGQHLGQWYCLTDCPANTTPGKIDDIKAWAAAQGWPVPQRPKNVRRFINRSPRSEDFEE